MDLTVGNKIKILVTDSGKEKAGEIIGFQYYENKLQMVVKIEGSEIVIAVDGEEYQIAPYNLKQEMINNLIDLNLCELNPNADQCNICKFNLLCDFQVDLKDDKKLQEKFLEFLENEYECD